MSLGVDCECHAETPVFVRITTEDKDLYIEVTGLEWATGTQPPWVGQALVITTRPYSAAGVRAVVPHKKNSPTFHRNDQFRLRQAYPGENPQEDHYGHLVINTVAAPNNVDGTSPGKGPEHG